MDINFNPDKQHTISNAASISGTGLHTGILVDMILKPASPGFGIQNQLLKQIVIWLPIQVEEPLCKLAIPK
jgi:UDP-3-O-acyl-N-acetylglucosamine deacetylase